MSETKTRFCSWIRSFPPIGRTETKNQKRETMHALHVSFSLPSLINSTSPILLCQEVQRFEVLKKVAMYTRMLALAMTIFVLLRKASCMTISMKGFISKAFKASTRVKVTLIAAAYSDMLSSISLAVWGAFTHFGNKNFLPHEMNLWKNTRCDSSEIPVASSKSSKVQPLPK